MALSDLVVIWGTNPVNTQVNVMTHAARARKERGVRHHVDLGVCLLYTSPSPRD